MKNPTKTLLILLLMAVRPLGAQTLPELDATYQQRMQELDAGYRTSLAQLKDQYTAALLQLETTVRSRGDLAGWEAVKHEIDRMAASGDVEPDTRSENAEVAGLQTQVVSRKRELQRQNAEGVVNLAANYTNYLNQWASNLTKAGDLPQALAVRERALAVPEERLVKQAQAFLAPPETAETPTPTEVVPDSRPESVEEPDEALGRPRKIEEVTPGAFPERGGVYRAGKEPKGSEKRVTDYTPSAQGSGMNTLSGRIRLVEHSTTLQRYHTGYSSYREKSLLYVGRVSMSPLPGKPLGKTVVIFDMYTRGQGNNRRRIRSDRIVVPPLNHPDAVVVDSGTYTYDTSKYRSSYPGYSYESASEAEFYGFTVSIFDETGNLIFQRCTPKALTDFARTTVRD